jgi:hypothetical protein
MEVFEVTSQLVRTPHITDDSHQFLGLYSPFLFVTPTLSSLDPNGWHAVRPTLVAVPVLCDDDDDDDFTPDATWKAR